MDTRKSNRRDFMWNTLKGLGGLALGTLSVEEATASMFDRSWQRELDSISDEEEFWIRIRAQYTFGDGLINLNNGGSSPQPLMVQDAFDRMSRTISMAPSYYMWRVLDKGLENKRSQLAKAFGMNPDHVAITRNTTESMDIAIYGLELEKGDEVVISNFDYPHVRSAWDMMAARKGIKLNIVELPLPSENEEELAAAYLEAISNKTKVVNLTHVINWTGQVMPVKKVIDVCRQKGITTIVDGAHSFAHLEFNVEDLGADFFATSLHKWLGAPIGTGMLWVNPERIEKHWPLFPDHDPGRKDIRKFEASGTRTSANFLAMGEAVMFHQTIGQSRKTARLRQLADYLRDGISQRGDVTFYTPKNAELHGALLCVGINGTNSNDLEYYLFKEAGVHCTTIKHEGVNGVRLTPNTYTTFQELDMCIEAFNGFKA